jgi:hypothetical protein
VKKRRSVAYKEFLILVDQALGRAKEQEAAEIPLKILKS